MKQPQSERGAVMLEGMIVTVITLMLLIWILGLGFLYYQKYTVRIVTNDAAKKVAATFFDPQADIIMGYISSDDIGNKEISYSENLRSVNEERAASYVKYVLDKANFANTVKDVQLELSYTADALGRSHVKVVTTCEFNTPFGDALQYFGLSSTTKYKTTSYADSTNITAYVSAVNLGTSLNSFLSGTGSIEKIVKLIDSFCSLVTHVKAAAKG